jgi:hypothetical protein
LSFFSWSHEAQHLFLQEQLIKPWMIPWTVMTSTS